ncbi:trp operon leader peptide [Streptomyces actuosus]|nr:trp operon leader peptide [Streptomyces actuosus]
MKSSGTCQKQQTKIVSPARCPVFRGRVAGMFALSTQNWWWTAHPAAH